jgi:hypothetical protein
MEYPRDGAMPIKGMYLTCVLLLGGVCLVCQFLVLILDEGGRVSRLHSSPLTGLDL